ncbi:WD40 repeat-like protein [Piromyces finnis]|uniref:WD40 repeat-like protein n=1 Tax=Piromyces finnis TaxID=1754191 RepID=A0A1Y1VNL0_9FUNG|nr:WD40 repeat-like protein [Piromyces finnis]|eukprot:ORX60211.1 WD40 repeat-like protein [Piromyces finnis]
MDPSAQNFLVNLFNSNKVDDSSDQNKTFPNSQSIMPQNPPNFQNQLPIMFNLNQAFGVPPPQNSNINKEMSQSLLSILQKKEPERTENSNSSSSPAPVATNLIPQPMINQNTLSDNTNELKKLLQINTTVDSNNSNNSISVISAPPLQEQNKMFMEPIKNPEKPKIQSNPNTPLFCYVSPFDALNDNNKEMFANKIEKSDSDCETVEIKDLNNDEAIISSKPKVEIEPSEKLIENNMVNEVNEINEIDALKNDIIFNLDNSLEKVKPPKEIITVVKVKRSIERILGKEIAVNNKYICYSSKNKNIRVIHQDSGDLRLFKGHEQKIIDIVVFTPKSQSKSSLRAASIDTDNNLILWTEDNNKDLKKLLTVKGINNGSSRFQRVLFHPSNENIVAVSTNTNNILLFDLRKYKENVITEINALEDEVDVQDFGYNSKINDFRFSSDGSVIVAGYQDGQVIFYDINSGSTIHEFIPHNNEPISSVIFVNDKNSVLDLFLITASKQNNEIKLWSVNDMSLIQKIKLIHSDKTPEYDFNTLEYNSQHQLLVMSNVSHLSILFSHIKGLESVNYPEPDAYEKDIVNNNEKNVDISNVEFEEINEFKIDNPVLNFIIDPNVDPLFNNENENVSLYCISTEEIYQYVINMKSNNVVPKEQIVEEVKIAEIESKQEAEKPSQVVEPKEKSTTEKNTNDLISILSSAQKEANKNSSNELLKLIKEGSCSSIKSSPKPSQEQSTVSTPAASTPLSSSQSFSNSESKFENSGASEIFKTISDLNNTNNLLKIFESNAETNKVSSPINSEPKRKSSETSVEMKVSNSDISKNVDNNEPFNVSQTQLHSELQKLETSLTSKMNEMFSKQNKRYEKLLSYEKKKRIEAEQKNKELITKTIKDNIKYHTSEAIEQTISKEIKNNVMPNLINVINQSINQQLNKQVEIALNKNIKKVSEKVAQSISKPPLVDTLKDTINETVKPVISDTVKDIITNYLNNDFQKTINYVILQANESIQNEVSKTIKNEYMSSIANRSNELDQIYKQVNLINTQIQNMQQQNMNMSGKATPERSNSAYNIKTPTVMPAPYVNTTMANSPIKMNFRKSGSDKNITGLRSTDSINSVSASSNTGRKSTEFNYSEIDNLIKEEKFEEIFTNLLIENRYFSQIVIIALIKQLSDNLNINATWRIEWLRCSLIVLNVNDEYIKGICPNILKEASEKMVNFTNEVKAVQPQSKIIDDMNTLIGAILYTLNIINKAV